MNLPKRIHIIGSVGSGKTTLAKELSHHFQTPHYELDNVVWERLGTEDRRRTEDERDKILFEIVKKECWVIEGVHHKW